MSEERNPWERPRTAAAQQDPWERPWQQLKGMSDGKPEEGIGEKLWGMLKAGGRGAYQGALDTAIGFNQLAARAIPSQLGGEAARRYMDQAARQSEQAYETSPARQAHPWIAGPARVAGNVAATAPMMAIPGMGAGATLGTRMAGPALGSKTAQVGARAALGALGGAGGAATAPVTQGDYWPEKIKQLEFGGAAGGIMGGAGGLIGPQVTAPIQKMAQAFPNLVRMATGVEGRTPEAFQRAMANQVLEPIGQSVSRTVKPGDALVNNVQDVLSDAYDAVKPHLHFDGSVPQFTQELQQLAAKAKADLLPARGTQYTSYLKTYLINPLKSADWQLDGEKFKRAESRLSGRVRQFLASDDPDQQIFGEHLNNLLDLMRDTLVSQNPQHGAQLQRINSAWRRYMIMDLAANRRVDSLRTFMPLDVMATLGSGGAQARRRISPDDELMRSFAEAGDSMLSGRQPHWQRLLGHIVGSVGGFAAGGTVGHPILGMGAGSYAGSTLGAGLSEPITRALETPGARGIGAAVSAAAPAAGAIAARRRKDTLSIAPESEPHVTTAGQ